VPREIVSRGLYRLSLLALTSQTLVPTFSRLTKSTGI